MKNFAEPVKLLVAIVLLIAAYWLASQGNCWDKYTTETQAILNCEGESK